MSKFDVDEKVLCYEPDLNKRRVLYNAKVLKIRKNGNKTEYRIHFQGWNQNWDRWADEGFVLKDIEENRKLLKTLGSEAQKRKKATPSSSHSRSKLKHEKPHKVKNILTNLPSSSYDYPTIKRRSNVSQSDDLYASSAAASPISIRTDNSDDMQTSHLTPRFKRRKFDLPLILNTRLVESIRKIAIERKSISLPAKINVSQIMENSFKYYGMLLMQQYQQKSFTLSKRYDDIDHNYGAAAKEDKRNLKLYAEFCDGMLILFNHYIAVYPLLIENELSKFSKIMSLSSFKSSKIESAMTSSFDLHGNGTRKSEIHLKDYSNKQSDSAESSKKSVRFKDIQKKHVTRPLRRRKSPRFSSDDLSSSDQFIRLRSSDQLEETHLNGCRRSNRFSQLRSSVTSSADLVAHMTPSSSPTSTTVNVEDILYVNRDQIILLKPGKHHQHSEILDWPYTKQFCGKSKYSCCSSLSSDVMCKNEFVSRGGHDTRRAALLDKIWEYRIDDEETYQVKPSYVYGIEHLLRLLDVFESILNRLKLSPEKHRMINDHYKFLLKFLVEHDNVIFSQSIYKQL